MGHEAQQTKHAIKTKHVNMRHVGARSLTYMFKDLLHKSHFTIHRLSALLYSWLYLNEVNTAIIGGVYTVAFVYIPA